MAAHLHGNNLLYLLPKPTPDSLPKQHQKAIFAGPSAATYSAPAKYGGTTPLKPPKRLRKEDNQITRCKRKLDFARLGLPVQRHNPVVAAKRNERERNRVKHINETFTVLKEHLPEDYDTTEKINKEMSKVEILRAAIEYIQTLEHMLAGKLQISTDIDLKALIQASTSPDSKSRSHQEAIEEFIKREMRDDPQTPPATPQQTVPQQTVPSNDTQFLHGNGGKISSDLNDNEQLYPDYMSQSAGQDLVQHNQVSQSHQYNAIQFDNLLSNNNNITAQSLKSQQSLVMEQNQCSWQRTDPVLAKSLNTGTCYGLVPNVPGLVPNLASPAPSSTDSACDQRALFDNIDLTDVDFTTLLMSM